MERYSRRNEGTEWRRTRARPSTSSRGEEEAQIAPMPTYNHAADGSGEASAPIADGPGEARRCPTAPIGVKRRPYNLFVQPECPCCGARRRAHRTCCARQPCCGRPHRPAARRPTKPVHGTRAVAPAKSPLLKRESRRPSAGRQQGAAPAGDAADRVLSSPSLPWTVGWTCRRMLRRYRLEATPTHSTTRTTTLRTSSL